MTSYTDSRKADPKAQGSLGFTSGQVVQEFYWDEDVDEDLRAAIEEATGEELVDVDYTDLIDGVIIWWRSDDAEEEDLADVLLDAGANLDDGGVVWVLTPKSGSSNHVPPENVDEAAKVAGMNSTSATTVNSHWAGMRLVAPPRQ
ncbi:MAG: DUF3052 domain-containing protein [Actinomycetaceae bacterium]|nr:DUF3052 domain-containing protein [Actinomycetaceae bacterium]